MGSNPFQSGERKVIPAVLVYARDHGRILMIEKQTHWNGLGGKCEVDESPRAAARREFKEEAGVDLSEDRFIPLGVLQFPNFKPAQSEDWIVFVFAVHWQESDPPPKLTCEEGNLHWIEQSRLDTLPLWGGDVLFLPYVMQEHSFIGTFWYRDGRLERHWLEAFGS